MEILEGRRYKFYVFNFKFYCKTAARFDFSLILALFGISKRISFLLIQFTYQRIYYCIEMCYVNNLIKSNAVDTYSMGKHNSKNKDIKITIPIEFVAVLRKEHNTN